MVKGKQVVVRVSYKNARLTGPVGNLLLGFLVSSTVNIGLIYYTFNGSGSDLSKTYFIPLEDIATPDIEPYN